jgi:hypothetical protein
MKIKEVILGYLKERKKNGGRDCCVEGERRVWAEK